MNAFVFADCFSGDYISFGLYLFGRYSGFFTAFEGKPPCFSFKENTQRNLLLYVSNNKQLSPLWLLRIVKQERYQNKG